MSEAKVKLFYFAGRGRAEVLRQILAAGNISYENVRFSFKEWPEYKKSKSFKERFGVKRLFSIT